jgi:replicative DNA helicase
LSKAFFTDEAFQDQLVALLCYDTGVLRKIAYLLKPDDFKPVRGMVRGRARWITAERALDYYARHHEPIGRLLRSDLLAYADEVGLSERQVSELVDYERALRKLKRVGADAVASRVVQYKTQKLMGATLEEMVELQAAGKLTREAWSEMSQRVLGVGHGEVKSVDYVGGLKDRMERRKKHRDGAAPLLFIDPLDALVRGPARGQLGVVMAPPKRGKSLFLEHVAIAYVIQRFSPLFITLEDPLSEVEDRLDAMVSALPITQLHEKPKTLRRRFSRFSRIVRNRLSIVDGTSTGFTCSQIEQIMLSERERGFQCDALIIDYDDEIVPERKQKERRFEFADIYRRLRQMAAQHNIVVWTAAQTQRGTESMKILAGERVAEDYSKVRKAALILGLGKGEWTDESIYVWVAAHKFDREHIGCEIVPDKERMLIYDRERTQRAAAENEGRDSEEAE